MDCLKIKKLDLWVNQIKRNWEGIWIINNRDSKNKVNLIYFKGEVILKTQIKTNLTSPLSLSLNALITKLHDKLSELGFDNIRPTHGLFV